MNRPPFERTEGVAALFEHARRLAAEIGFDLRDVPRTGGGSDGNFTAALGSRRSTGSESMATGHTRLRSTL